MQERFFEVPVSQDNEKDKVEFDINNVQFIAKSKTEDGRYCIKVFVNNPISIADAKADRREVDIYVSDSEKYVNSGLQQIMEFFKVFEDQSPYPQMGVYRGDIIINFDNAKESLYKDGRFAGPKDVYLAFKNNDIYSLYDNVKALSAEDLNVEYKTLRKICLERMAKARRAEGGEAVFENGLEM